MNTLKTLSKQVFYHSNLLYSLRILISLAGTTFVPWYFNNIQAIVPLTLGVIAAGLTEIDTRLLSRFFMFIVILICFAISSFTVQILFNYPILFIISFLAFAFVLTMIGVLGQRYSVIAFGSLIVAAYTTLGHSMYDNIYTQPMYLLIGAVWYNVVSFTESTIVPIRTTQQTLSDCFVQLSHYLDAKAALFDPDETDHFKSQLANLSQKNTALVSCMNQTKNSLFQRLKSYRGQSYIKSLLNYYFVAQDIHERVSATHVSYHVLSQHFKHSDILFRFARILNLQSKACRKLASCIKYKQNYEHDPIFEKYFGYLEDAIKQHNGDKKLINALMHLQKNLQGIDLLLQNINNEQQLNGEFAQKDLTADRLNGFKDIYLRFKQNFTLESALFRHAVRICVVLLVDYIIIELTKIPHGYWIILTSIFVCQPNYSTTKHRLKLRILGTIGGILLGFPLSYLFPTTEMQLLMIILSGWLFFIFKNSQYAFATAFITLVVIFIFGLLGESGVAVSVARIASTVIGCAISWCAVTFIWPDWKFRNLSKLVTKACQDDCEYLALIGVQYLSGKNNDVRYRQVRRNIHENNADILTLVSLMTKEPKVNQKQIDEAFRFITINHTIISYLSTLSAHRDKKISSDILKIMDKSANYAINSFSGNNDFSAQIKSLTLDINHLIEAGNSQISDNELLVLQQILLILDILPETAKLVENLTNGKI